MEIFVDLHIHTSLSPCSSENMTPNNIINMSLLKGLDAIAITDHNATENCEVCMTLGKEKGLLVIPGMELQTKEEAHFVCLFEYIKDAHNFKDIVYDKLPNRKNDPKFFGNQWIYDRDDNIIGENERLLINSVSMSCNEAYKIIEKLNGVMIPAHVDKRAFSIIANLGFIPTDMDIKTLEISRKCDKNSFLKKHKYLSKYNFIKNSDAHFLGDILEKENFLEVEEKSIKSILGIFKK
ncbi:MAG: PHP domain-containing protein [Anaeromicrobium sp.]|jgi:PHP family Zn ribbon phosphoesterase|uniref:PHP domain-containing protein n=1 Tax=Anaeromicrobium sp. TaxID=1929132 RepID=UPI0025FC5D97|nr:PHP domain-containing protein [Anaeromicrobium sp.]MCT4594934.1 PHP domain-containing protein [Anaeromicrobium sp.]